MKSPKFTYSLSFRLPLLVATVVFVGVCLIAGAFLMQDLRKTVELERARLQDAATAFAAASSGAVISKDTTALYGVLRGISEIQHSTFIEVRDLEGQPIAELGAGVALSGRDGTIGEDSLFSLLLANNMTAEAVIWSNATQIGTLSIQSDISWLRGQFESYLKLLIMVALVSAAIIAASTNLAIRRALQPLKQMSKVLLQMEEKPDTQRRFPDLRKDEIGVLAHALNNAFDNIQQRDKAIRRHRDTLELTVQERTAELRVAADDARHANAAKSDFLATMSHEIRTPMNGMLVMAELLSASGLSPRQQRFAEVISRSGSSLLHIINDILDLAKVESGKLELEEVPFSLETLIEDTINLFSARAHEKALKIGMVVSPKIASQYVGDPTRLGQILSNLTNNALKFTDQGGVTIRVDADGDATHHQLTLSVVDTGIGIAPEKLSTIFEAFSQADQSTTRNYGGTGLGLSISKRFTEAMGGQISVASLEGKGTAFSVVVTLPVFENRMELITPIKRYRVGVADGSDILRQSTYEMLHLAGLEAVPLDEDFAEPDLDLILTSSQSLGSLAPSEAPILVMSEYGDPSAHSLNAKPIVGKLQAPLGLTDLEKIVVSLNRSEWSALAESDISQGQNLTEHDFSGLSVLAVDDNAVNREVLNEALSVLGVKANFATSGQEAIDHTQQRSFDIIFMDCSMPGMDGYQATAAIRQGGMSTGAHIVALTAHVTGPAAEQWRSAGMDSYIAKPFTVTQLENALKQVRSSETVFVQQEETLHSIRNDIDLRDDIDLISSDVISMFETVSAATGNDMKTKVFSMFCEQADQGFDSLMDCIELKQDTGKLKELAHALKSMCSSAGARRAQLLCDDIEVNADKGNWPSNDEVDHLRTTLDETVALMRQSVSATTNSVPVSESG